MPTNTNEYISHHKLTTTHSHKGNCTFQEIREALAHNEKGMGISHIHLQERGPVHSHQGDNDSKLLQQNDGVEPRPRGKETTKDETEAQV